MSEKKKTRARKFNVNFCPYCKNHPREDHGGMMKKSGHECDKKSDDHLNGCEPCRQTNEDCKQNVKRMQKYRQDMAQSRSKSPSMDIIPSTTPDQESSSSKI